MWSTQFEDMVENPEGSTKTQQEVINPVKSQDTKKTCKKSVITLYAKTKVFLKEIKGFGVSN